MTAFGIETERLAVGYEKKILIGDVTLQVRPGELLTLIGPNGSGKSTILRTIVGELEKLGGVVRFSGEDTEELSAREAAGKLSMVMTERVAPELMTCRELVETGRYSHTGILGILGEEDHRIVEECIAAVGAEEVADREVSRISDGQRQRVMLARALAKEPEILVLDEPTSFLDIRYKLDLLRKVRRYARERGIAVLLSLHELDLAAKLSDRVAVVAENRIVRTGEPAEVFTGSFLQEIYGIREEELDPVTGELFPTAEKSQYERTDAEKVVAEKTAEEMTDSEKVAAEKATAERAHAKVFVIGGGGSAIPLYYRLMREEGYFSCGVLWESDAEYRTARALAQEVVTAKPYHPIGSEEIERARKLIDEAEEVFCTLTAFGPVNERVRELIEYTRETGKLRD